MKYKTLRRRDTKEFVHIEGGALYTCASPLFLGDSSSIEMLFKYYVNPDEQDRIIEYEIVECKINIIEK